MGNLKKRMKVFALIALAAAVAMEKSAETPDVDADTLLEMMEPEQMEQALLSTEEAEPANDDDVLAEELPEEQEEVETPQDDDDAMVTAELEKLDPTPVKQEATEEPAEMM